MDEAGLSDRFEIASAGTGDWHLGEPPHHGTLAALRRHDVPPIGGKRAQVVTPAMLAQVDYIVGMDAGHVGELSAFGSHVDGKVSRLLDFAPGSGARDVPDPYYSGRYEEVYQLVVVGARGLLEHIRQRERL